MSIANNMSFLLFLLFAGYAAASAGDDFSNNLFSDLAPLLALFGERVTMQFMSQSTGWADNIILAMAPLGIITAIVSAIRVGGPSWLKAIIGRARENLAIAEADLMSSTSNEVCELWNGQEVVRCMGSAPIREFVCLLDASIEKRKGKDASNCAQVHVVEWEEAIGQGTRGTSRPYLERFEPKIRDFGYLPRSPKSSTSPSNVEEAQPREGQQPFSIIITRNPSIQAPNITLNSHDQFSRGELYLVAIFGTMLQLGVLVYSGFATYYPTLKFHKDKIPVARYAFPCTAVGTLVLVLGVLVCAHVVESSTKEDRYRAGEGINTRLVWLQQTKTVNDQNFKSCAIFAESDRTFLTTSTRRLKDKASESGTNTSPAKPSAVSASMVTEGEQSSTGKKGKTIKKPALELMAILGVVASLCGYILQFIGLRGMYWTATVVQLVAVMVMTCLRVFVRRGLAKPPRCESLTQKFELEWFAMTMGKVSEAPWLHNRDPKSVKGGLKKFWSWICAVLRTDENPIEGKDDDTQRIPAKFKIKTGASQEYEKLRRVGPGGPTACGDENSETAHNVMTIRRKLGELANRPSLASEKLGEPANWLSLASAEALALARAIEISMDALFGSGPETRFTWCLPATYDGSDTQLIRFDLERPQTGKWKVLADDLDAALALWLFSVHEQEEGEEEGGKQESPSTPPPREGRSDAWLRATGSPAKQSLRLLGQNTPALHRDLQWWIPRNVARIIDIKKDDSGNLEVKNHRVVGCGPGSDDRTQKYESQELGMLKFDEADDLASERETSHLATEAYGSLKSLYALDMFSAFMWAAAKTLSRPIDGGAEEQRDGTTGVDSWKNFTLRNNHLSKMAQDIQSTGLESLDQIYLSIIPPLSVEQKLPQAGEVIEIARQQAKRHEQLQHWKEAGTVYLWLFRAAATFEAKSGIAVSGLAVLMEHMRMVTLAVELRKAQGYEDRDLDELREMKSRLEKEVNLSLENNLIGREIFSSLVTLYKEQGRKWKCDILQEVGTTGNEGTSYPDIFNYTDLHQRAGQDNLNLWDPEEVFEEQGGRAMDSTDIHRWTPLHYAAAKGAEYSVRTLLKHGVDVNARDLLEWTPLHYACQHAETSTVQGLIREGAEIDAQGRDGVAPLHFAAMNGRDGVVKALVEAGATLDVLDALRNTPLHWAAYEGHEDVVRYLSQDANKKLRDHMGRTALHLAAISGKKENMSLVVELLADKGAGIEAKDRYGRTPLHYAAREAVAALLIKEGADVKAEDALSRTPLHSAAHGGREAVAALLIEKGADVKAEDAFSETPLHYAARGGREAVAALLIKEGADVKAGGINSHTPLHYAACEGHEAVAALLIEEGADVKARDINGQTPLHYAAGEGREAVAALLIKEGADIKARDVNGHTPLLYAAGEGHEAVAALLIKEDADVKAEAVAALRTP